VKALFILHDIVRVMIVVMAKGALEGQIIVLEYVVFVVQAEEAIF